MDLAIITDDGKTIIAVGGIDEYDLTDPIMINGVIQYLQAAIEETDAE